MLIDASIVDSITANKNVEDEIKGKSINLSLLTLSIALQEFNRRVNNMKQQDIEEESSEDSEYDEDGNKIANEKDYYYEDTRNFYKAPKEEATVGGGGKKIRMLN